MIAAEWRQFTPAYTQPRGAQEKRLGAHAFREGAALSLCGYVWASDDRKAKIGGAE